MSTVDTPRPAASTRPLPPGYRPDPLVAERAEAWALLAEHGSLQGLAAEVRQLLDFVRLPGPSDPELAEENEAKLLRAQYVVRRLEHLLAGVQPVSYAGLPLRYSTLGERIGSLTSERGVCRVCGQRHDAEGRLVRPGDARW